MDTLAYEEALRRFHAAAATTMVSTPSLMSELTGRGFTNLGMWTRGVDTEMFSPDEERTGERDRSLDRESALANEYAKARNR